VLQAAAQSLSGHWLQLSSRFMAERQGNSRAALVCCLADWLQIVAVD
jgi:hypothetical protein